MAARVHNDQINAMARAALVELTRTGGCTIDPKTARPVPPAAVFAVSKAGLEQRFAARPTFSQIIDYIQRHLVVLFGSENAYLGGWGNEKTADEKTAGWYLDITELHSDRTIALAVGRANGQQAITHLLTLQTIWLKEEDRKVA